MRLTLTSFAALERVNRARNSVGLPPAAEPAPAVAKPPPSDRELLAARTRALGYYLRRKFPDLFGDTPRPLQIGIHEDLEHATALAFNAGEVAAFLWTWTRSPAYLATVAAGGDRVGLDGVTVEPVSAAARRHAARELARITVIGSR